MTPGSVDPSAQVIFRDLVKRLLSPRFRELGFVGSSGRYSLPSETSWALLGLLGAKWNTQSEVQFTINLLVAGKAIWAEARSSTEWLPERPAWNVNEYAVFPFQRPEVTTRLAHLLPGGEYDDRWWTVDSSVDLEALAGEVVSAVSEHGLPWLRKEIARVEHIDGASDDTST
jgi:Domain of unknown function (DUF4304)